MSLLLLIAALPALAGEIRWFYPDETGVLMGVAEDGRLLQADGSASGLSVGTTSRVVVRTTDPAALSVQPGVGKLQVLPGDGLTVVVTVEGAEPFALSRQLHDRPDVAWAHPDLVLPLQLHAAPDDPFYPDQWYLENTGQMGGSVDTDLDAEAVWDLTRGAGQLVAVIDSGTDPDHPDLNVVAGWDYVDGDADSYPADGNGHGTAVAGMVGALADNGIGVAGFVPEAQIYGIRLLGGSTTTTDVRNAFFEGVDAGASVLNNSWGYGDGCASFTIPGAMREGLNHAEADGRGGKGTVVVTSAGNGNCDNSDDGFLGHRVVVGVAAVDGSDQRESYSSFGSGVDITGFAGGNIVTTDISGSPGYGSWRGDEDYTGTFSGTSSAAPSVSGVIAAMFAVNPELTAAEVRDVLCATAERIDLENADYDEDGWGPWYGCGRVSAEAAVRMVANTAPAAPVLLGPTSDPWEDAVVLRWEGADPEGDVLTYQLRLEVEPAGSDEPPPDTGGAPDSGSAPEPEPEPVVITTTDTRWVLTGEVAAGDTVRWSVVARDRWTESPASETGSFTVVSIPAEPVDSGGAPEPEDEEPIEEDPVENDEPEGVVEGGGGSKDDPGGCAAASGAAGLVWVAGLAAVARRRR
jgi:subtilisin family serine protease